MIEVYFWEKLKGVFQKYPEIEEVEFEIANYFGDACCEAGSISVTHNGTKHDLFALIDGPVEDTCMPIIGNGIEDTPLLEALEDIYDKVEAQESSWKIEAETKKNFIKSLGELVTIVKTNTYTLPFADLWLNKDGVFHENLFEDYILENEKLIHSRFCSEERAVRSFIIVVRNDGTVKISVEE
jgi:hypothetical protein